LKKNGLPAEEDGEQVVIAGACTMVVSETSLVHYTRRPKAQSRQSTTPNECAGPTTADAVRHKTDVAGMVVDAKPVDDKYWKRRYNYFARFDEGIRLDTGAWFEVTPESVARHIADRLPYDTVVDGTCGVGGNAIQFAITSKHVIAVDTNATRLQDAAHNAAVYGVQERIEFVHDDFANFAANYSGPSVDAVFLSPPWGGPSHLDAEYFSLKDVECPDIVRLFAAAVKISHRIVLYLPRHINLHEAALLAAEHNFPAIEVEKVLFEYPTPHLKLCVLYYGPEATAKAMAPPAGPSRKAVGPTGGAAISGASQRRAPTTASVALCGTPANNGPAQAGTLLSSLPLAGPVIRALHCRCHYLGRYIVALALALENELMKSPASKGSTACAPAHDTKMRKSMPRLNTCANSRDRSNRNSVAGNGTRVLPRENPIQSSGIAHDKIARALCKTLGSGTNNDELAPCLTWLLGRISLGDTMRLATDAAMEHESAYARGNVSTAWDSCLFSLLQQRFPAIYSSMLDWRKAMAVCTEVAA